MSTNPQNKRITKQIRVFKDVHKRLKFEAVRNEITISRLADYIINNYFKEVNKEK